MLVLSIINNDLKVHQLKADLQWDLHIYSLKFSSKRELPKTNVSQEQMVLIDM